MSKKVLFVATVLRGHILVFHLPYMQWFREQGYEVHLCARNDTGEENPTVPFCDQYVDMPFERSPLNPGNLAVYKQLKAIMDEENYALIHCHTPVGGMMGRLCARASRKRGTRVVYTAHGFHFFDGAPALNWLLYYPAERFLAKYTDLLITINEEDSARAKRFKAGETALVRGVGIELGRFAMPVDRRAVRAGIGVPERAGVVICVGEHIPRKNHETVLRAVAKVPDARVLFCGVGELEEGLKALAEGLNLGERVKFLGFRKDIGALLAASDVFFFPSFQEGLPVSLMEAMAAGLPCVASKVRGNADLIRQGENGMLRLPLDVEGFAKDVAALLKNKPLREQMGAKNREVIQAYGLDAVRAEMGLLYQRQLAKGVPR